MPIVNVASRNAATQQSIIWNILGEVRYLRAPSNAANISALQARDTLDWILANLEIKQPINPVPDRDTMIKRCRRLIGGKAYS